MDLIFERKPSGFCPIQAEGKIGEKFFYFRARGNTMRFYVSETFDFIHPNTWVFEKSYGDEPFAAGMAPHEDCMEFIEEAMGEYKKLEKIKNV